nr:hypothetical protein [uncultured Flavobacterium sp.]
MLLPTAENKKLIVELMKVTEYENYFLNYCMQHIETIGAKRGMSAEKILACKNKVNYNEFFDLTISNQFAIYTSEELQEMIALCKKLNTREYFGIFFSTESMQSNLELEVESYLKE